MNITLGNKLFNQECAKFRMKVNINKTKVINFVKQRVQNEKMLVIKTDEILFEQISKFKYLSMAERWKK